jgi:hypothetical protein
MTVQFPEEAVNPAGADVLAPLKELQQGLQVLPADKDIAKAGASATFVGPPDSVAIIEAGATALSKWWSVAIAALGGTAVIISAVTKFWNGESPGVRIGLIAGMAAFLAASVLAISVIVSADLKGRAQGMVALYAARADIANQFLRQSLSASMPASAAKQGSPPPDAYGAAGAPNAAAQPNDRGKNNDPAQQAESSSERETLGHVATYLASSAARALVLHKPSDQVAHLAGLRQLDDGSTQVLLIRQSDQQTTWCAAADVTIMEFTYE